MKKEFNHESTFSCSGPGRSHDPEYAVRLRLPRGSLGAHAYAAHSGEPCSDAHPPARAHRYPGAHGHPRSGEHPRRRHQRSRPESAGVQRAHRQAQGDAVQAVWDRIASEIELPSFGDMDSEILSALYGIDSANLVSYIGKIPLMNVQATEVFIAQVKEGSMDAVKSGIEKRQADLVEQWSTYLPEQLELVQNYKLVTNGNYVLFAISYEAAQMETIFNDCTN